jgi:hypothetical protein
VLSQSVNVSLSIELGSEPISGFLAMGGDQAPRPFSGWVELAGAIEDIRGRSTVSEARENSGVAPWGGE